jgi:hypothetical protein
MNRIVEKWNEEDTEGRITLVAWMILLVPAVFFLMVALTALCVWGGLGLLNDYFDFIPDDLKWKDAYKIALGLTLVSLPFRRRRNKPETATILMPIGVPDFSDEEAETEEERLDRESAL